MGMTKDAADGNVTDYRHAFEELRGRHWRLARDQLRPAIDDEAQTAMRRLFDELRDILHGVELVRECTARTLDYALSFGERLSCTLVAGYLRAAGHAAQMVDAREMIVSDATHGGAVVQPEASYRNITARLSASESIPIVTGFIAATQDNITTTLGRNGSDYTASLLGVALRADQVEIWTDVSGIYSADPRAVSGASLLKRISYEEAMELAYFGAEVIHPNTMMPVIQHRIPIRIKGTHTPQQPGTIISVRDQDSADATPKRPITGIASIKDIALINIIGSGMSALQGIASRIFASVAGSGANIIMISQASSRHSICFVCRRSEADAAIAALRRDLLHELAARLIDPPQLITGLVIVAVVGENMRGAPGMSGRLFGALGNCGVNVLAIAQGSSEMNISFVISEQDHKAALNGIHDAFF